MTPLGPGTTVVGRYTILGELGQGGNASVHRAHDQRLGTEVALKVLWPQLAHDTTFIERFRREAQALAKLSHPNILRLYELGEDNDLQIHYLVLEYMTGGSLKDRLGARPWTVDETLQVLRPVGSALDYLHSQQPHIVHRDLKPSNILFTADGRPVISDFGVARLPTTNSTDISLTGDLVIGTPAYMAPDQINGKASPSSDRYALGVIAYELLVGRVPHHADTSLELLVLVATTPAPPPRQLNPAIKEPVQAVLLKALARLPARRYATADAFIRALEQAGPGRRVALGPVFARPAVRAAATATVGDELNAGPIPLVAPAGAAALGQVRPARRLPFAALVAVAALTLVVVASSLLMARSSGEPAFAPLVAATPLGNVVSAAAPEAASRPTAAPPAAPLAMPQPRAATAVAVPGAPPVPTLPPAETAWQTTLAQVDALGDHNWPTAITLLQAFVDRFPEYIPATDRLEAALLANAHDLLVQGHGADGVAQVERASGVQAARRPGGPTTRAPSVVELWDATLRQLDSLWGTDWPAFVADAEAFSERYPDFAPAREKLYSALVEYSRSLIEQGKLDDAETVILRAQELLPDRTEAFSEATVLTPTATPAPTPARIIVPTPASQTSVNRAPAAPPNTPVPARPVPTPTKSPFQP